MEKFTELKPAENKKPEIIFNGDYKKLAKIDDWEVNYYDNDSIICIPYFEDTHEFIMRREVIPPYRHIDGDEKHLVCVAGMIEDGESAEDALYRELYEETGIVVKSNYERLKKWRSVFSNKSSTMTYHMYFIPLVRHEYDEVIAPTDGGKYEQLADTVKVHIAHINKIMPVDSISSLCVEYLKNELKV